MKISQGLQKAASTARDQGKDEFTYRKRVYYIENCTGAAHDNAHNDHCMVCAPFWGYWIKERTYYPTRRSLIWAIYDCPDFGNQNNPATAEVLRKAAIDLQRYLP